MDTLFKLGHLVFDLLWALYFRVVVIVNPSGKLSDL